MTSLVLFGWVFHVTKSPGWFGVSLMCHRLPLMIGSMIFAPISGHKPASLRFKMDATRALILLIMAAVAYHTPESEGLSPHIIAFLLLASLRSFLSGADGPTESTLISTEAFDDRARAAKNQQTVSLIVGASGFIATVLFIFGSLKFSVVGVLIFDSLTFVVSSFVFSRLRTIEVLAPKSATISPKKMLQTALRYPEAIILTAAHCIRMVGISVALQQWLLLFQVKFAMGPHSSGYLYLAFTLAWFLSAQVVRSTSWRPSLNLFLILSTVVCLFSPVGWFIPSVTGIFASAFLISFVDGALLASIGGDFQRYVREKHIPEIFGNLNVWTQVGVVGGSLIVGWAAERLGYESGSLLIGGIATLLMIFLLLLYVFLKPMLSWLWHFLTLKRFGYKPRQTYEVFESIEKYFELPANPRVQPVKLAEATCMLPSKDRVQYSAATLIAPTDLEHPHLTALNLAMFETMERVGSLKFYESKNLRAPVPSTSGIAVHTNAKEAFARAKAELIERDSILAHYYFKKAPLFRLNRETALNFGSSILKAAGTFDECDFFCFSTSDKDLRAWLCVAQLNQNISLGWGIAGPDSPAGIEKSLSEAVASYRFHCVKKLEPLKIQAAAGKIDPVDLESFSKVSKELEVNHTDVQMAIVLCQPDSRARIQFLWEAPVANQFTLPVLKNDSWIPELPISEESFDHEILGNLIFSCALSPLAFEVRWPRESPVQFEAIRAQRFSKLRFSENIKRPCLYY